MVDCGYELPANARLRPRRRALSLEDAIARLGRTLRQWWRRARERRQLARFDDRDLRDIGLTRADAAGELAKPFWRE